MGRSTVHYADSDTNNILKKLHNKLRPAGTPVQRVEYIIELLLLKIFEVKVKRDPEFGNLRKLFNDQNHELLFSSLAGIPNDLLLPALNTKFFPFYSQILTHARKVYRGNLSSKVQDQLVLVQEVFSNSNFTNNVKSGNLKEIVSLVSEIEEERLLKTDLLGDAIESALSETGGTKDLGLHRTPDHVRQFMVGLVSPSFSDTIDDPACGTGGFLFDSFEYVMEAVSQQGHWPGPKAHAELRAYFKKHFAARKATMPRQEVALDFYRRGIMGIEYLGMIRKMAAINFYIRGLNPSNIAQGDSLALFDPHRDGNSKSVVLANPPFGAERDQEAYPNVWEEFSRESETTILFVKLMFEMLKPGGRCAVVVSEGLMSWDQNSAHNLRKLLLDEANLQAIISLPQGVFVSKGGQGPKTSILLFEKGKPTKSVWFYRVTSDGYSMGTNRKEVKGCQLAEALALYDKFLRQGKTPPETPHSFSIPAAWIKALDPRVKERIRAETTAEMTTKADAERQKLSDQLADGKLSQRVFDEKAAQLSTVWTNRIQNEIAKRIERAHEYSFNLPNYRTTLSESQLKEWAEAVKGIDQPNGLTIDARHAKLMAADLKAAETLIAHLDPYNALELDIAKQYVTKVSPDALNKYPRLKTLAKIIESGAKYPRVKLAELLTPKYDKVKKDDYDGSVEIVEKIAFGDGQVYFRDERSTGMDLYLAEAGDLITSKINIHQGAVALAPRRLAASTHYQVYGVNSADVVAEYLVHVMRTPEFINQLIDLKNKGIKNEQGAEFLLGFEIPFPLFDAQAMIAEEIRLQQQVIQGADTILDNWEPVIPESRDKRPLKQFITDSLYGIASKLQETGKWPVLRMNNLDARGIWRLDDLKYVDEDFSEERKLRHGDFIFNRTNSIALVGKSSVVDFDFEGTWAGYLIRLRFSEELNPWFVKYLFATRRYRRLFSAIAKPAGGQANINAEELARVPIDYYPLEEQIRMVESLTPQYQAIQGVVLLKSAAEVALSAILHRMWGDL